MHFSFFFVIAHSILLSVETVNTLSYLPHSSSLPPPPPWPLRSLAFLLSHLIQFITVGPPPYTQLSGETKALPNMDAFLFPWICAALPWGYCAPSSPPAHTHTLTASTSFPVQKEG